MPTTTLLRFDPDTWLRTSASCQAAVVRRCRDLPALPGDGDALDEAVRPLVSHLRSAGTHIHEPFQKSYGEALLQHCPAFGEVTAGVIAAQWAEQGKIGHYELYSALVMGDQDPGILAPTLDEIHTHLRTWNNEGWCPWTPALWLRILWLARDQQDSWAAVTAQLEHIDAHLSEDGLFQDREPFCLMHAVGQMDHPVAEQLRDRLVAGLASRQDADGSWGEFSYSAHVLLQRWGL